MNIIGNITENEVLNIPVPQSTDSYTPIKNRWIMERLQEELDKVGLTIHKTKYQANQTKQQVIGQSTIHGPFSSSHDEIGASFVWGNSYDKSKPVTMGSGVIVYVCSNGQIDGKDVMKFSRKHTGDALKDVETMIQKAVQNLEATFEKFQKQNEILKEVELSKQIAAEYLGRLYFEEKILSSTQLSQVKKAYFHDENFKAFNDGEWTTGYRFYNNVTEALKSSHPGHYIDKHAQFNEFAEKELVPA